jgi:transcriptional regulator with XRE-family HTH domain
MNVGRRIKEARQGQDVPVTALAYRCGVSPATIYRIESGDRTPSMALLDKIARELRVEPAELLRESVPKASPRPEPGQQLAPEAMPGPSGHALQVGVHEGEKGTEVTYTKKSFLELYREIRAGTIAEDEAVERFERLADEGRKHSA